MRFFSDDLNLAGPWNSVQNDQLLIEREMDGVACAPAIDAALSDAIHLSAASLRILGARMAKLAQRMAEV